MDNKASRSISHICFIGAGHVGGPTAAVIAKECPNVQVTVVDRNIERIKAWQSDELPVSEPNLLDMVRIPRDGLRPNKRKNLHFTTQLKESIQMADIIMVSVDTPTKAGGTGSGYSLDISSLEELAISIAEFARSDKIVVEKSTVPVGTGQILRDILNDNAHNGVKFEVLSNPEFLAEGTAIQNLVAPDRILIGSSESSSGMLAAKALADLYAVWLPRSRIITINLFSSELSKLAANALLAQRVSSVNALSVICEATGADIDQVAQAVGSDSRIGPHMLRPSIGFGGSCFGKDIRSLVYLCRCLHLDDVAAYWDSILHINEMQKSRSMMRIVLRFHNNLNRKKIAILGFAFKKDTADTRESCAVDLVKGLLREGASVSVYDPYVKASQIHHELGTAGPADGGFHGSLKVCNSGEEACEGAHAVIVATNWDIFNVKPTPYPNRSRYINSDLESRHLSMESVRISIDATESPKNEYRGFRGYETETSIFSSVSRQRLNDATHYLQQRDWKNTINGDVCPIYLDWNRVAKVMKQPRIVLGSSECLDQDALEIMGFDVEIIGKKPTRV